jgi:RNA-splicing ligase RtcB
MSKTTTRSTVPPYPAAPAEEKRLVRKLRDEAPSAYKDIAAVTRAQRELTRIVRKLRPVLSYKGV